MTFLVALRDVQTLVQTLEIHQVHNNDPCPWESLRLRMKT
jgi:hypothetical protein